LRPAQEDLTEVFTEKEWKELRDPLRYLLSVRPLRSSYGWNSLKPALLSGVQVLCFLAFASFTHGAIPEPNNNSSPFFDLTVELVALMLVFRTDACYTRWDEARREISDLVDCSRALFHLTLETFRGSSETARCLVSWTVAYGRSLKLHLLATGEAIPLSQYQAELSGWLNDEEMSALSRASNAPSFCLQVLKKLVRLAPAEERPAFDAHLDSLSGMLSHCEVLSRVPIPSSYNRHTSRILFVWLFALPLYLWKRAG